MTVLKKPSLSLKNLFPINMNKLFWLSAFCLALILTSCENEKAAHPIRIFHAGSLSYPMRLLTENYQENQPEQSFLLEAAGSLNTIRKVTDLQRQADLVGSADYQLIDQLLIPVYSRFNIAFASNSIVLAYADPTLADTLNQGNWLNILLNNQAKVGASDPNADPCGYRARLCLQLAGMMQGISRPDEQILSGERYVERPKETDLIVLLNTQTIDYLFTYESLARQYELHYLKLSDSVNLSDPRLNSWYQQASLNVRGSESGDSLLVKGEAIIYGISVLKTAEKKEQVWDFVEMILQPEIGGKILQKAGLHPLNPALVQNPEAYPKSIISLINHQ